MSPCFGVHILGLYNLKARVCNELNSVTVLIAFPEVFTVIAVFLLCSGCCTGPLNAALRSHIVQRRMRGRRVNDELGTDADGSSRGPI